MGTIAYTAQQLYNMLTSSHCNCKQYISVSQTGSLVFANETLNTYGVFEDIPVTKDFIVEYDLTLGTNRNPCFNLTFGSHTKPTAAQSYGYMMSISSGGELWLGSDNSPSTIQQSLGLSNTTWYGTAGQTYHIKLERSDNTVNLYIDNVLTQSISDNSIRNTSGGYFGFFNWDGKTCSISNFIVTSDIYLTAKKYVNSGGVYEIWSNVKNWVLAHIGNGTLTINVNGQTYTFRANQATDVTINIPRQGGYYGIDFYGITPYGGEAS